MISRWATCNNIPRQQWTGSYGPLLSKESGLRDHFQFLFFRPITQRHLLDQMHALALTLAPVDLKGVVGLAEGAHSPLKNSMIHPQFTANSRGVDVGKNRVRLEINLVRIIS